MTRTDIASLLSIIATIWPNAPQYREEHAEAFLWVLGDCDPEEVKGALAAYVQEGHAFPPVAGQLYKRIQDLAEPIPDWGAAWREVLDWVHAHGSYDPPGLDSFSHPAIYVAVKRLGYREICESNTADVEVWLGHFRRIYDGATTDHQLAPARAAFEAARAENPFALPEGDG